MGSGEAYATTLGKLFSGSVIGENFGSLVLEFVTYNANMEYVLASKVSF